MNPLLMSLLFGGGGSFGGGMSPFGSPFGGGGLGVLLGLLGGLGQFGGGRSPMGFPEPTRQTQPVARQNPTDGAPAFNMPPGVMDPLAGGGGIQPAPQSGPPGAPQAVPGVNYRPGMQPGMGQPGLQPGVFPGGFLGGNQNFYLPHNNMPQMNGLGALMPLINAITGMGQRSTLPGPQMPMPAQQPAQPQRPPFREGGGGRNPRFEM